MDEQTIKFLNRGFMLAQILIVGVLVFFVGQILLQNKSLDQQNIYQITVSGEGKVYAKPDVALISLGVTSQATTVSDVTKANTDKMNTVIAAVKKLGVADKDIQTTNYNLTPNYTTQIIPMMYPVQPSGKISGYTLEQTVQVKIRDFTKVGDILSQVTSSGANLVGDLQFTIDNPEQFKEQARAQAIKQAKTNAQNLAKTSGINLGKIINVYENYIYPMAYANSAKLEAGTGAAEPVPAPTIQPGQQEISVTINLTYQVK
ncbi:MAG: SIMPL domain-containing protein [Candidatus Staskawiczbacteria bacterium]|nr:SIMPL domain-containing protein [Candidatus Staskawiczbacteria bacterium]